MHRPGANPLNDDGADGAPAGGNGDSANLAAASPIVFVTGGPLDAEGMGNASTAGSHVVCANDGRCVYAPNAGPAAPGDLETLVGEQASGTWQLCVGDSTNVDTGTLGEVRLGIVRDCAEGEQDNDLDGVCTPSCESGDAGCDMADCDDSSGTAVCS
jgi:hypothetical protein